MKAASHTMWVGFLTIKSARSTRQYSVLQSLEFLWTFQVFFFSRELFKIQFPGTCLILSAGTFGGIIEPRWRPGGKELRKRFKESNGDIWRDGPSLVTEIVNNLPMMQDTQVWSLGQEYSLEKGLATHSCILAWRIPWTEEPGGLQSMESQRVGHDWQTNTFTFQYQKQA